MNNYEAENVPKSFRFTKASLHFSCTEVSPGSAFGDIRRGTDDDDNNDDDPASHHYRFTPSETSVPAENTLKVQRDNHFFFSTQSFEQQSQAAAVMLTDYSRSLQSLQINLDIKMLLPTAD